MNKKPDQLTLDVIQCMKDGYGVHYGAWKANQQHKQTTRPEGSKLCLECGKWYKPARQMRAQKWCSAECRRRGGIKRKSARRIADV